VYLLGDRAPAEKEYSDERTFKEMSVQRLTSGAVHGSDSYPKLFHSIASNNQPEPTKRRVTRV
jgi:hypothetical protein